MSLTEQWIEHNGKKILYHDYQGLAASQLVESVTANSDAAWERQEKQLLLLVDVRQAKVSDGVLAVFKQKGKRNRGLYDKIAIVGVEGVKALFLKTINQFTGLGARPFKTKESALDWLAS